MPSSLRDTLIQLFGDDAAFVSASYLTVLNDLRAMALDASEQNARKAEKRGSAGASVRSARTSLARVYAREAGVFASVARALHRAAVEIQDILSGADVESTPPPTCGAVVALYDHPSEEWQIAEADDESALDTVVPNHDFLDHLAADLHELGCRGAPRKTIHGTAGNALIG